MSINMPRKCLTLHVQVRTPQSLARARLPIERDCSGRGHRRGSGVPSAERSGLAGPMRLIAGTGQTITYKVCGLPV